MMYCRYETLSSNDNVILYKSLVGQEFRYSIVLQTNDTAPKYMRLLVVPKEDEAVQLFSLYASRVAPIAAMCKSICTSASKLQVLLLLALQ